MAFANIFTRLTAIDEDVINPRELALAHRELGEQEENAKSDHAKKRKLCDEESGSNTREETHTQMQSHQAKTIKTHKAPTYSKGYNSKPINDHRENSERASVDFTKELELYRNNRKTDQKVQNVDQKSNHNVYQRQQQQQKKKKKQKKKNRHKQIDREGAGNRRGCYQPNVIRDSSGKGRMNKGGKHEDVPVVRKRLMTQEFQDQNGLLVDGRIICRHFLCGRCIKGDDCQLEHVQGVNDLIKEVCKFYVQKFCTKGERCPYMHNSFPCKFFHIRGNCSYGTECRFSHEPLTDLTKKLLDEAIQRDNELNEIVTKSQQDASVQPKNSQESLITKENTVDILLHPIRPMFYNSSCPSEPHAEKDTFLCQTEGLADIKDAVPPHATDANLSHSPPSSNHIQKELVSYSVEAVLGIKTSKPFPSLFSTSTSRESTTTHSSPQTSFACSSNSANQSEVPYSIFDPQEVPGPLSSSAGQNEKVAYSVNTAGESNKPMEKIFKNFSSSQVPACQISTFALSTQACTDLPPTSGGRHKQNGDIPESQKPTKIASHKVKLELSHPASMLLQSSKTQADRRGGLPVQTSPCYVTSRNQHLPRYINSLQDSAEPQKARDTVLGSGNCKSKVLPVGPTKPLQSSFHSLFSCPPSQKTVPTCPTQLKSHLSCMPSGQQDSLQSPHPSSSSTDCKSEHFPVETAVEPVKATTRSFLSLFAVPVSESAPVPCIETKPASPRTSFFSQAPDQPADSVSHSGHCKRKASNLETPFTDMTGLGNNKVTPPVPRSPYPPPRPKRKKGKHSNSAECKNKSPVHLKKPTSDSVSEMSTNQIHNDTSQDPSTTQAQQDLPDGSSHKASSKATTINSALKTLFLSLSPYCQDGEQQDNIQTNVPLESDKFKNGTDCALTDRQLKREEEKREEVERTEEELKEDRMLRDERRLKVPDSNKQSANNTVGHPNPAEHQPYLQNQSRSSREVTGGLTSRCPGMRQAQVRPSVTLNLPVQPVAPPTRLDTQPSLKQSAGQKCVNGSVGLTPLKNLFKHLDPSASPFGQ